MALLFLSPNSPELNPVEHIWDDIRENWFGNEVFNSMQAVEDQLERALATLEREPEKVASMTGFPWLTGINLSAA